MEYEQLEALMRLPRNLALAAQGVLTPIVVIPCALMLAIAETPQARLAAGGGLLLWFAAIFVWFLYYNRTARFGFWALLLTGGGGIAALGCAVLLRPSGIPEGNNLSQRFSGEARFEPMAITNLVPEVDQLSFGTYLLPGRHPYIGKRESVRLRGLVRKIYRELNADPSFKNAGSVLGFCYEDILFGKRERLHFFEYVPRQLNRKSYPVLIFLHGSLGNFLGYTWVLKRFADETRTMIVAPTYGAGNWEQDKQCEVVKEVLRYCAGQPHCDNSQIYLGGISDGGIGVGRTIAQLDQKWAGVVWISPVIEKEIITKPEFRQRAANLPMLVVHGGADDLVSFDIIKDLAEQMRKNGASVATSYYPKEDHFLLFSQPNEVTDKMAAWLKSLSGEQDKETTNRR